MLLAGLLNLASVLVPRGRALLELLDAIVPGAVSEGATALTAATGIGLVLLSGGMRRHRRSAYLATVALLAASAVLHLIKGLDLGAALLESFLAGMLVARGEHFTARLGPGERAPLLWPALAVPVATVGYGLAGLLVNQGDVAADLGAWSLLEQAGRMALGLGASVPLHGRFGRAFPASVAAVVPAGGGRAGAGRARRRLQRLAGLLRVAGGPRHRWRRRGAGLLPLGRHGGAGRRRPARAAPGLAGRDRRLPRGGGAAGPGRRRHRLRRRCGRPLRRRWPAHHLPRRRGGHRPGDLLPGRAADADRPPELEPGEAGRAHLPDRPLGRAGRRHPVGAGRHLRPLAGRHRRARLLDGARTAVRPARRRRHRGRRPRRGRSRARLPAPGAVGPGRRQPGRDAPGARRAGDPQRLPD